MAVTIQVLNIPPRNNGDGVFSHYNNYIIFKESFFHLVNGTDLYIAYPDDFWDLYKYSPAFSLMMGAMAWMPDWAGLLCWNLINVFVLFLGLRNFTFPSNRFRIFFWLFILMELFTSMQNSQCNVMIIGLFLLAYQSFEKKHVAMAALFLVLTVFIKLFGLVAFAMFLLYPKKGKFILYSAIWFVLFALIPIVITGWDGLIWQYQNWADMLQHDHSSSTGLSVIGWLDSWFGLDPNKLAVVLVGGAIFLLPLIKFRSFMDKRFRIMFLASASIWVIIFNHKAESATFIIAVVAAYLWFSNSKKGWLEYALIIFCFIFTVLSPTDVFPGFLKDNLVKPYVLKAVPCIFIWIMLTIDMLRLKPETIETDMALR